MSGDADDPDDNPIAAAVEDAEVARGPRAIDRVEWTEDRHAFELSLAEFSKNDAGNAQRMIGRKGGDLIHIAGIGWHGWDGQRWSAERGPEIAARAAHFTAACIATEAEALFHAGEWGDETTKEFLERLDKHRKWAVNSGNGGRINAMVAIAKEYLARRIDDIDAKPFLFNVTNGTLELGQPQADGTIAIKLLPHNPDHLITRVAPVVYDPEAECPIFRRFIERSLPDPAVRMFLQAWFGYTLTGSTEEQCLVLFHGAGSNGKGRLVKVLLKLLGNYGATIPFATLLHHEHQRGSDATPDIARLPGVRLVVAAEPEVGARFSEAVIKTLTGEDMITARNLRQDFFDFDPQFKITLSFNNQPTIRGTDEGIWRRLLMVPFNVVIPRAERDRRLSAKLEGELSGILNWLLEGYVLWRERGLDVPEAVRAATASFRDENDPIGRFLDVAIEKVADGRCQAARLYDCYVRWCKAEGTDHRTGTMFGRILREKGYEKETVGVTFYTGIRLKADLSWMKDEKPGEPPPPEPGDVR